MIKYKRKSGSIIELKDTKEMAKYALDNGLVKVEDKPKREKVISNDRKGG
jgi:hypothetical protein